MKGLQTKVYYVLKAIAVVDSPAHKQGRIFLLVFDCSTVRATCAHHDNQYLHQ